PLSRDPDMEASLGPSLQAVIATGKGLVIQDQPIFIHRGSFEEEHYFTAALSPIPDDDGAPCGVLALITDTTATVIGRRRAKTLTDLSTSNPLPNSIADACCLGAALLGCNPYDIPFACIYLLGRDGRAVLCGTTGVRPDTRVSPPVIELKDSASNALSA